MEWRVEIEKCCWSWWLWLWGGSEWRRGNLYSVDVVQLLACSSVVDHLSSSSLSSRSSLSVCLYCVVVCSFVVVVGLISVGISVCGCEGIGCCVTIPMLMSTHRISHKTTHTHSVCFSMMCFESFGAWMFFHWCLCGYTADWMRMWFR